MSPSPGFVQVSRPCAGLVRSAQNFFSSAGQVLPLRVALATNVIAGRVNRSAARRWHRAGTPELSRSPAMKSSGAFWRPLIEVLDGLQLDRPRRPPGGPVGHRRIAVLHGQLHRELVVTLAVVGLGRRQMPQSFWSALVHSTVAEPAPAGSMRPAPSSARKDQPFSLSRLSSDSTPMALSDARLGELHRVALAVVAEEVVVGAGVGVLEAVCARYRSPSSPPPCTRRSDQSGRGRARSAVAADDEPALSAMRAGAVEPVPAPESQLRVQGKLLKYQL